MISLICQEQPGTITRLRDGGDTVVYFDQNDCYHNVTGPAILHVSGSYKGLTHYFVHNIYHRVGGPARIIPKGIGCDYCLEWRRNNFFHRLNAPAIIRYNTKLYYEYNVFIR